MNFESDFSRLLKEHFCLIGQKYIVKKSKNYDCCNIIHEKDYCDKRNLNSDKIFN